MNKIELRYYQKDIIKRAINAKGNILIQAPKINLLEQTASAFKNLNPQIIHGSNKEDIDLNAHSFVSTIQNNPNFRNEMLGEDIENQDYSSRFNLSLQKDLNKESQLKLGKSKEDSIKINLLKNYKSKEIFFACLDSIPSKNEQIKNDEQDDDWFSKLFDDKSIFIKEILKSKHCNSDVIKNLIETKHDSYVKKITRWEI